MSPHGRIIKKVAFVAIALVVSLVALSFGLSNASAGPSLITERPLGETAQIVKALNVAVHSSQSPNSDLQMQVYSDYVGVSFVLANRGVDAQQIDVDRWELSFSTSDWLGPTEMIEENTKVTIPAGESISVARFDISKYSDFFELFPATYMVELKGLKVQEKDFGEYTKFGTFEEYYVQTDVTVAYDTAMIKSQSNRLLKAEGLQIGIEGSGDKFDITDDQPKKVSFYLVNSGTSKTSAMLAGTEFTVWNSDYRNKGDGITGIAEYDGTTCNFLSPGEKILVGTYEFSKSSWPIAKNGIAEKIGTQVAVPGTYIAFIQAATFDCTLENGEKVPGGVHTLISAFEVRA